MLKYQLIFLGEINDLFQLDRVRHSFKKRFKLSESQTNILFSGKEIILKKDLNQHDALQYALHIDGLGGVCYIEAMKSELFLPEGVTFERRNQIRRAQTERRLHDRSTLNMDRRIHHERRSSVA